MRGSRSGRSVAQGRAQGDAPAVAEEPRQPRRPEGRTPAAERGAGVEPLAGRGLLAWYADPISTGPLEGVDNTIKLLQRLAYGYRDLELFKLRILSLHTTR
ncbi:MAG: transposase [Planctomycetaceae bacterium]